MTADGWMEWLEEDGRLMPIIGTTQVLCQLCWGPTKAIDGEAGRYYATCYDCSTYRHWLDAVVPISYATADGLEALVWGFKDNDQRWLALPLGTLLKRFLDRHLEHIAQVVGADIATVVPSHPRARHGWDHMKRLVRVVKGWEDQADWDLDLLVKTKPSRQGQRGLDPQMYVLGEDRAVRDASVVLIDDVFTNGGTLTSAAMTLKQAGAERVTAVSIGRILNPAGWEPARPVAESQSARAFDIDECVLE